MRQLAAKLRAETREERRISGDEDDPVTGNRVEEEAADEEEEDEKTKTMQTRRTRTRRKRRTRVTATQGMMTKTMTHHQRLRTDW